MTARARILLADDHAMLLDAFRAMLQAEFEIVGAATDGRTVVAECARLRPDVVLLDVAMPLLNGIDAGRQILAQAPRTRLIYLTMNPDGAVAAEALALGAWGYVLKSAAASELVKAIREVLGGRSYIAVSPVPFTQPDDEAALALTPRQREVLQLLAEGRPMKEVAYILDLTPRTVAFHKYRIMQQLRLRSSAELVRFAVRRGLVA